MPQWSIGICTPVPMVPVDAGAVVQEKIAAARTALDAYGGTRETDAAQAHRHAIEARRAIEEAMTPPQAEAKHLGLITPEWQRARAGLAIPPGHANIEIYADGMEIGVARNAAVHCARQHKLKYIFFIDWDTLPPADALFKLAYHLDNNPEYGVAAGMYCMKTIPPYPLIWRQWNAGIDFNWTLGDVLKGDVCGVPMGCTLVRLSIFDDLPEPWFKTCDEPVFLGGQWGRCKMTEDLYFTKQFTDRGGLIMVDTSVFCEHIDHATGRRYTLGKDAMPYRRAIEEGRIKP